MKVMMVINELMLETMKVGGTKEKYLYNLIRTSIFIPNREKLVINFVIHIKVLNCNYSYSCDYSALRKIVKKWEKNATIAIGV